MVRGFAPRGFIPERSRFSAGAEGAVQRSLEKQSFVGSSNRDRVLARVEPEAEVGGSGERPDAILALGNEALFVTTGHSGTMKWRGKELEAKGTQQQ